MGKFIKQALILTGFIIAVNSFFSCRSKKQEEETEKKTIIPVYKYGLPVDSFFVVDGIVKSDQYLGQILNEKGVAMGAIDAIARKSKPVFDVRRIKSGNNYTFFLTSDSAKTAKYFVYENSATEYFVYELFDSLRVYRGEKETVVKRRSAQGEIKSSLWNAMKDNNLDPILALKLENIFAWTIDFFAIQKGDRFRAVYEELFVDSVSIGIGDIYAVEFDHGGRGNYAFRFFQDDRFDYFDESGMSLRRAFRKAPLDFFRISSRFSNSRMHPVLRIRRPHHGVDYAAPKGTPVMSIGDGTVVARAFQAGGGGNYVKIKHNSVYTTAYMHLSGFAGGITPGARVKQGQVIGFVGATGLATGPHLDFRVYKSGAPVDPLKVEAPPVEPVKKESMPQYVILKDSLMAELEKIEWPGEFLAETR